MINILDHPPLVEFPDGHLVPFERDWLEFSLREAARNAGCADGHFASHVAESVAHFLRQDYPAATVPSATLSHLVENSLRSIGFSEVAACFFLLPPPVRISLLEVAESAGHGFELHFFTLLARRLRTLLASGARQIACEDLRPCVKVLRQAKRWRNDCRGLNEEIVSFIRSQCVRPPLQASLSTPASAQAKTNTESNIGLHLALS